MRMLLSAFACIALTAILSGSALAANPAVLIVSPHGAGYGYLDLDYLNELHQAGFEVDYTDSLRDVTWDRIKRYNVLVVFVTPDAIQYPPPTPPTAQNAAFVNAVKRFAESGGGVFLWPGENNLYRQQLLPFTEAWGAKLPAENLVENDPEKQGAQTHDCHATPLACTDQIPDSPVSEGVKGIWYPVQPAYNGGMGGPLLVDENWQVVVNASATAVTKPVDMSKSPSAIPNPFARPGGVTAPPLVAIRSVGTGRVALVNQWPQFSIGSGTKWIFNREVLDRGVKGKPSDFGRLLQNTFRWLAAPSLESGAVGGCVTNPQRLLPPNQQMSVKKEYAERTWPYDAAKLGKVGVPASLKLYRGLIGAKSAFSSGTGSVEQYARAAQAAGLDFLVFMEDFAKLTPAAFEQLKAQCRQYSSDKLLLLAGFNITSNIGNHMFFYGPDPVWPPDLVLTGANKSVLYIQEVDAKGNYTGYLTPYLDWVLGAYHVEKGQVGYYDFQDSPNGMRLHDCRLYAMAGVRYYRDGKLIEDITDDYLTTADCTIPPTPASVNEVTSPEQLTAEVASGHALTFAEAESLDRDHPRGIFKMGLRWTHQYDGLNAFQSDGPKILAWPDCYRVWTLGGEEFVRGNAVMPSPILVTSAAGLKEIRLYNGPRLFRRFLCNGAKRFEQVLVLDGTIQKDLVLIAEDVKGGKAVSFARRCWKDGALAPAFCSDHVNDGMMFLAHGPFAYQFNNIPGLPENIAGYTWDGGPPAIIPVSGHQSTLPVLETAQGKFDANRLDQIPHLDFTDEGATAVMTDRRELYDERILAVVNPWHTYGPIAGPARVFENIQRYRQWVTPTVGVPDGGWAAPGVRVGVSPSLFTNVMRMKTDVEVKNLQVGFVARKPIGYLVVAAGDKPAVIDMAQSVYPDFLLKHGQWFGFYPKALGNAQILFNRGPDLKLQVRGNIDLVADLAGRTLKAGESYITEIAGLGFPVDVPVTDVAGLEKYVAYLANPTGLQVLRGTRIESPGLLEIEADDGAVELSIPRPPENLSLTLPLRLKGLNPRWSAGLFQKCGYSKGFYGSGENRYRALGTDADGYAYVPLYVDWADITHMLAGHPISAGSEAKDLFIQVTNVGGSPDRWHISVNNPTDVAVTTVLRRTMELPGLDLAPLPITLQPGEYVVIR